jgi:hypothetical protein
MAAAGVLAHPSAYCLLRCVSLLVPLLSFFLFSLLSLPVEQRVIVGHV